MKQLLVDVSELIRHDIRTGIQRVTRSVLFYLCKNPPPGYTVLPVYASLDSNGYFYADFACRTDGTVLHIPDHACPIRFADHDVFLGLDLQPYIVTAQEEFLQAMHLEGVIIYFVVYDLLPVRFPWHFPERTVKAHRKWLDVICRFSGILCDSRSAAMDFQLWLKENNKKVADEFDIQWFHCGGDFENSLPTSGLPRQTDRIQEKIRNSITFLMVGTLEARKAHKQVLDAFEILWKQGKDVVLIIVGKEGWNMSQLVDRINEHDELGKRLFWLNRVSDEYLDKIYTVSTVLLHASEGEGFGLPVLESVKYEKPLILRDIPVFREIAGESAFYFSGLSPEEMADKIAEWLVLFEKGVAPSSEGIKFLTWEQSTKMLLNKLPV